MTVQELIDELNKIEDKSVDVRMETFDGCHSFISTVGYYDNDVLLTND